LCVLKNKSCAKQWMVEETTTLIKGFCN
jgi:hypothetical protein